MDIFQTIALSVVEGITEFLPISSTGHLILAAHVLQIPQTEFLKSFEIAIQLGAILSIIVLYWRRLFENPKLIRPIVFAFLPTAFIGFALYKVVKNILLENTVITLLALFIGGIILILIEKFYKGSNHTEKIENLTTKHAIIVGLVQSFSIVPGVSRAAATIIGGMFVGLTRQSAVEFSFLLAVPTMAAATGYDLMKSGFYFTGYEWSLLLVGFIGAFITAMLAVKYFLSFIQKHTFIPFGIYRIILAILFFLVFVR